MMTNEQLERFEQNKGLAYTAAYRLVNSGYVPKSLTEDAVQECMIGLMQAVEAYDESRGLAFSTLAMVCCRRRVGRLMEMERKQTRVECAASLDDFVGETDTTFGEWLIAPNDTEAEAVDWMADVVRYELGDKRSRWATMLLDNVNGKTMDEIAIEFGVTRQFVSNRIGRARKQMREAMAHADW